ncbi:hypothetical protein GCM10028807_28390 [Spirosoma daeguense]
MTTFYRFVLSFLFVIAVALHVTSAPINEEPSSFACSTPGGLNSYASANSAILRWGGSSATYDLQWRVAGSANWNLIPNLVRTDYPLTGLAGNTAYEWQVRGVCQPSDVSVFSPVSSFTTVCIAPFPLGSGVQSATSGVVTWDATSFSEDMKVNVRWWKVGPFGQTPAFTVEQNIPVRDRQYVIQGLNELASGASYAYQLRSVCPAGDTSEYSNSNSIFLGDCSYSTPYLYTDSDELTNTTIRVRWRSLSSAPITLMWRVAQTGTWNTITGLTGSSYTLKNLTTDQNYQIQVFATCPNGQEQYSNMVTFKARLPVPYAYRADFTNPTATNIAWFYNPPNTEQKEPPVAVRWKLSNAANWEEITNFEPTYYPLRNLQPNQTYQWQIKGQLPNGDSPYSDVQTFSTSCLVPNGLVARDLTATSARLVWYTNLMSYDVQYRRYVGNTPTSWTAVNGVTTSECSLSGLVPGSRYEWQVRTVCGGGVTTAFVGSPYTTTFITQCTLPFALRTTTVSSTGALLRWNGIINMGGNVDGNADYNMGYAPEYTLQWRAVGASNWNTVTGITSTTYALSGLTAGIPYEWRLTNPCAGDPANAGTTGVSLFYTYCIAPDRPYSEQMSGTSARLRWSAREAGEQYTLRYRALGSTNWITISNVTDSLYRLTNLANQTTYQWQVQRNCSGSPGPFTSIRLFTTSCQSPIDVREVMIASTATRIGWTGIPGVQYVVRWGVSGSPLSQSATTVAGASSYDINGLTSGTAYNYVVKSQCADGSASADSELRSFTAICGAPAELRVAAITPTSAVVQWSGPTSLSYVARWRVQGGSWTTVNVPAGATSVSLTGLTTGQIHDWQVQTVCGVGQQSAFATGILTPMNTCPLLFSLRAGNWNDPTLWSCGRIPMAGDTIEIRHVVNIPAGFVGNTQNVTFTQGGKIVYAIGSSLQLGQ